MLVHTARTLPLFLLGGLLVLSGCDNGVADDDDIADDDDTVGDDDDLANDDDVDFAYAAATLRGALVVQLEGDDDDSSVGDDDDSSGSRDVSARAVAEVEGTFVLDYWRDFDAALLECVQTLSWSGAVEFETGLVGNCADCTGLLLIDAASVADTSNRAIDPEACDPADFGLGGQDLGSALTGSPGGLLQMTLMDTQTAVDLGVQISQSGLGDLAAQAGQIATTGNRMTHVGFVSSAGGTFFDQIEFDSVAGTSGDGEPWSTFWFVFRPDPVGGSPETNLSGAYQLGSFWILQ